MGSDAGRVPTSTPAASPVCRLSWSPGSRSTIQLASLEAEGALEAASFASTATGPSRDMDGDSSRGGRAAPSLLKSAGGLQVETYVSWGVVVAAGLVLATSEQAQPRQHYMLESQLPLTAYPLKPNTVGPPSPARPGPCNLWHRRPPGRRQGGARGAPAATGLALVGAVFWRSPTHSPAPPGAGVGYARHLHHSANRRVWRMGGAAAPTLSRPARSRAWPVGRGAGYRGGDERDKGKGVLLPLCFPSAGAPLLQPPQCMPAAWPASLGPSLPAAMLPPPPSSLGVGDHRPSATRLQCQARAMDWVPALEPRCLHVGSLAWAACAPGAHWRVCLRAPQHGRPPACAR